MKNGFVILNYNSSELTKRLAKKIRNYKNIDYVIIVDNFSNDNSVSVLSELLDEKIKLICSDINGGYSSGNNLGIKKCKDLSVDIAFVANPDVNIEEKDIDLLIEQFQSTKYAMLTAVQYEIDGSMGMPPILIKNQYINDLLECSCIYRKINKKVKGENINYDKLVQPIDMFRGSFFGIRVDDFLEIGGFDENIFLYCEERILASKLEEKNKQIGLVTNARYDHMHSMSISKEFKEKTTRMRLLYTSRMYYNIHYNRIGSIKRIVLKLAMRCSLAEFSILDKVSFLLYKKK